jgi:OHCU decarboxylase
MAAGPAGLVGLGGRKGSLSPGADADLVLFDPDAEFTVDPTRLQHRHPATPYEGRVLAGRVVATYLRGSRIASEGQPEGAPSGRPIGGGLDRLNALPADEARAELLRCCGSGHWADRMAALRPFSSIDDLLRSADAVWSRLDPADQLEAFTAHPRIGDLDALRTKFATTASWASAEQAGVSGADEPTLRALADGNLDYEARFGHIFIVCATGKSAGEMLTLLRERLGNDPTAEHAVAASEQAKITRLRLRKLFP